MLRRTVFTFAIGMVGAVLAVWIGLPAPYLLGPAILVSIVALTGQNLEIPIRLRNGMFMILGVGMGSGVTPDVLENAAKWPISLIGMMLCVVLIMWAGSFALRRLFAFDGRSALLAATPGHLSFVLSLGLDIGANLPLISAVQTLRVLMLTVLTPAAIALFTDADLSFRPPEGPLLSLRHLGLLLLITFGVGMLFTRLKVPAAFLLAAMAVSAIGHGSGLTPGSMPALISIAAFVGMGTLIGTRFSGISFQLIRQAALSAVLLTGGGFVFVALMAAIVARLVGLPFIDVLIAYAPGALETMVAMSAVIGADTTFVGFHHLSRMFFLSFIIPLALSRTPPAASQDTTP